MNEFTKFDEEVAELNEIHREAAKAQARDLFKQREALENDPRRLDEGKGAFDPDSPASKWLDDICRNSEALLRIYIDNIATNDWTYKQLTGDIPHVLEDIEGEKALLREVKAWAQD